MGLLDYAVVFFRVESGFCDNEAGRSKKDTYLFSVCLVLSFSLAHFKTCLRFFSGVLCRAVIVSGIVFSSVLACMCRGKVSISGWSGAVLIL